MKRLKMFFNRLSACIDFLFNSKDNIWAIVYNIPNTNQYVYSIDDNIDETNEDFKTLVKYLYSDVVLFGDEVEEKPNIED